MTDTDKFCMMCGRKTARLVVGDFPCRIDGVPNGVDVPMYRCSDCGEESFTLPQAREAWRRLHERGVGKYSKAQILRDEDCRDADGNPYPIPGSPGA